MAGLHLRQAVAAEFVDHRGGDFERDDVFHDHARGRDGAHVAALIAGGLGLLRVEIDRLQRLAERADRLLRGPHDDRLAIGHAGLETAGVVGRPFVAQRRRAFAALVVVNRIVDLRAGTAGRREAQADFDALDRLHGHHRLSQPAVELAIPLGVRAQAEGHAVHLHLDDAAERVAVLAGAIDQLLDRRVALEVESVDFALIADGAPLVERAGDWLDLLAADLDDEAEHGDVKRGEQLPGQRPGGDSHGRLAPRPVRGRRGCCPSISPRR